MSKPKFAHPEFPCTGCAHSASSAPFPGHPSGERPCGFCVRNTNLDYEKGIDPDYFGGTKLLEERDADGKLTKYPWPAWYDGSKPLKVPADNYISTDRLMEAVRAVRGAQ